MDAKQNRISGFGLSVPLLPLLMAAVLISAAAVPRVYADDKQALVVFNTWVEVPGGVLPGGRYIFKEVDTRSGHVTQIIDEVSGTYIATVGSKETERRDKNGENVRLEEGQHHNPDAVRAWFRPGSRNADGAGRSGDRARGKS
jgi:hypothetical protein